MHKFSTTATKSSGVLHRLCDPQAGAPARGATHSGRRFRCSIVIMVQTILLYTPLAAVVWVWGELELAEPPP